MDKEEDRSVQIGDWVQTESSKGESIHGFVEKAQNQGYLVQLRVIASDNKQLQGQTVQVNSQKLSIEERFADYSVYELKQLIDLSLLTGDKAWFDALSEQYQNLQKEHA